MASDFSRTLALLRREKRISQRTAAGDLQVSQALLSHYENGLREPGLSFVVRAAEYYGVSCDYLLGRSMNRDNTANAAGSAESETADSGSEFTAQRKKLIADCVAVLLDAAERSGSKQLSDELMTYLSVISYKLFRYLYAADTNNPQQAFRTDAAHFDSLCDARLKLTELRIRSAATGGGELGLEAESIKLPDLSLAALPEQYPGMAESVLQILQEATDCIEDFNGFSKK